MVARHTPSWRGRNSLTCSTSQPVTVTAGMAARAALASTVLSDRLSNWDPKTMLDRQTVWLARLLSSVPPSLCQTASLAVQGLLFCYFQLLATVAEQTNEFNSSAQCVLSCTKLAMLVQPAMHCSGMVAMYSGQPLSVQSLQNMLICQVSCK